MPILTSKESELVAAAEGLHQELIERGNEIDELRQLPQDIAERMAELGFYRLLVPAELGGLEASPAAFCRISEVLAQANGSTAWCMFIGTTSQYLFGALESSLLAKMLENPNVITSGVFADSGTALAAVRDGEPGYVINGHWSWGSGCHNAAWISGGVHEVDADGEPVNRADPVTRVFFQPDEIEIMDNWHVSGLRGSGSSDYAAAEVWVPAERMATSVDNKAHSDRPIYRFPRFGVLGIPIGAIAMGMARASIDEVMRVASEKTPMGSRRTLAMRPSLHSAIAVADTELSAARAWFYQTVEAAWAHAQEAPETLDHRRAIRTANVHAVKTAVRVIDTMYTSVGGTSVYETSCLQRHFRDVHVATQHMMVSDSVMEVSGRIMLGLDDKGFGI
ncbi:MAG: alkylation response protein AidB-like acyl-CoA dehydrogenase [Acidimicrobiales bacterium]|jgi:indole-3-acetate monooxygenase